LIDKGTIRFGELLTLRYPRIVERKWFSRRVVYQGEKPSSAMCEIVYPQRLRTPLIGRIMEKEIVHA
jgi:hypothetical protein